MNFGICSSIDNSGAIREAGWDFVEVGVQGVLQGLAPDAEWTGPELVAKSALPTPSANVLVPGTLKITGPDADLDGKLRPYMTRVLARAPKVGIRTLVFGSGGARNVPEGFDRGRAFEQVVAFARTCAEVAAGHGVTLVFEPLNRKECNIINSVAEAMEYVRAVNHPNMQCLVDSYHFWLEDEPLENLRAAMPHIRHVHVADKVGRVAPGLSGEADYRPFFRVLKDGGYAGSIAVEAGKFDVAADGARVLAFVKDQWNQA
jgi:sugar phosphate isomerase/epimerase